VEAAKRKVDTDILHENTCSNPPSPPFTKGGKVIFPFATGWGRELPPLKKGDIGGFILLFLSLLISLLLCNVSPATADTLVGGVITTNTVWTPASAPYLVTSNVIVQNGATLTIESGVTLYVSPAVNIVIENGALRASGTTVLPVIITSDKDISGGTPAPGDWGQIRFLDNSNDANTILEHVSIRYGQGLVMQSASPTLNYVSIEHMSGPAITVDLNSFPAGTGNSAVNNAMDVILVPPGEMLSTGTWGFLGIPYYLEGVVSIGQAPQIITISPAFMNQGDTVDAVIVGNRLSGPETLTFSGTGVQGQFLPGGSATLLPVRVSIADDAALGARTFDLQVAAGLVSSAATTIFIRPAVPIITSVNPATILVNRPPVVVELTGKFYSSQSVVLLDGVELPATFTDDKHLSAEIPTQSVAGLKGIQVRNPDPLNPGGYIYSDTFNITVALPKFTFAPDTLTMRQGENGTLNLTIPFAAPAGDVLVSLTSTAPATATVPSSITIPEGASAVDVTVTALNTGITHDSIVEIHANQLNWTGGKATVTVRPPPTINLVPTSILTGQGFQVFLTVSLTDPAPAGGLNVTLSAAPANIISLPSAVTVPAGATQAQVTITAIAVGNATVSAASSGSGYIPGDVSAITVRPVSTYDIGPVINKPVGVVLTPPPPPPPSSKTYSPVEGMPVGVALGPVITGLTPDRGAIGTNGLSVRINGSGLSTASAVSFAPADGITVQGGSLTAALDGSYVEVSIDIASSAPVGYRVVVVSTSSGMARPAAAGTNIFKVTYQPPQLWSLLPNYGVTGTTFALQVNGRNLQEASKIEFIPPDGISIGNPPSVDSAGILATVNVTIAPGAATGIRVVRITTPGGSTESTETAANRFDIRTTAGTTYAPVVSGMVGVMLESPDLPPVPKTYSPVESMPVGIAIGPVITNVSPKSGAITTQDLLVQINGKGLETATDVSFAPATGITIRSGTFTASPDGNSVSVRIDIASDAPLGDRTVVVTTPSGTARPASAGANQFKVTLLQPEILGMLPIRKEVGSTFTLTLHGKNLASSTLVNFIPAAGITVANPPAINTEGNIATVQVIIASDAPVGDKVVTITAPGGTTTSTPSAANTFTVTALPGVVYEPVTSPLVGVTIETAPLPPVEKTYEPFVSREVGVVLTPPPPGPAPETAYGPVSSRPVGVTIGSLITGISVKAMEPGNTIDVTLTGIGLDQINGIDVLPADGMTLGTWNIAPDGLSVTISLTAASDAPKGPRFIIPLTASGQVSIANQAANLIYVGPRPSFTSIDPILQPVGTAFTLTIHGTDLKYVSAVRFEPSEGIIINSTPSIDVTGTQVTVDVIIEGTAQGGQRVVIITTPYGDSSSVASAANTFTVYRETGWNLPDEYDSSVAYLSPPHSPIKRPGAGPSTLPSGTSDENRGGEEDRFILTTNYMALRLLWEKFQHGQSDSVLVRWDASPTDEDFKSTDNMAGIYASSALYSLNILDRGPPTTRQGGDGIILR